MVGLGIRYLCLGTFWQLGGLFFIDTKVLFVSKRYPGYQGLCPIACLMEQYFFDIGTNLCLVPFWGILVPFWGILGASLPHYDLFLSKRRSWPPIQIGGT